MGSRTEQRGAATRSALLAAAREVFAVSGFAQASVTGIVARAGASVGSLYHHFSGKAELYLALFDEFQRRQQERTGTAIRTARDGGESDPMRLFIAAARAYLDGCLAEHDLSRLFTSGDGPPGFEIELRRSLREWARRNAAVLQATDEPSDEALVLVATSAMAGTVAELSTIDDEERARRVSDEVLAILGSLEGFRRAQERPPARQT
ncbi:MAG: TetR family transcriptional regulator [Streptosporangiales bacterium]|nr:TetR family transcriptional regulator [Streptosporangiales bacterium]